MEDFSGAGEAVTHGLADSSIRSDAKTFGFDVFDILIVEVVLGLGLLRHVFKNCK